MNDDHSKFLEILSIRLPERQPRKLFRENYGRAAVLMPICQSSSEPSFLLTERTHEVETHKGQISFPGGIMDPEDDTLAATALRETWEEIGLPKEKIHIWGQFDDYLSVTGLIVTPFVATIDGTYPLVPNPGEVAEILTVPFSDFNQDHLLRIEMRQRFDHDEPIHFYDCHGKIVWGLTARIIRDFLDWLSSTQTSPCRT